MLKGNTVGLYRLSQKVRNTPYTVVCAISFVFFFSYNDNFCCDFYSRMTDQDLATNKSSWIWSVFNWTSGTPAMLRAVEKKIFAFLKTPYRGFYVDIGPAVGNADKIWTVTMNTEDTNTPLVLLHGLGAGVALWVMNFDSLAANRPVYAIDIIGFGRSSRPTFSSEALTAEKQIIRSIEEWRREMNLKKFIIMGHSMGGFLAASYAMKYPDRVHHLILADPWGFPERPADIAIKASMPMWVRAIAFAMKPLNPLWAVRAAGPLGHWVVEKARPDIVRKFSGVITEDHVISQYIYQCNAQTPSGESAFHSMMENYGWAKHPMINRIHDLRDDIPITMLYGSRSWVDSSAGEQIKAVRPHGHVNIQVISGAGHHVYADKPEIFNKYVNDACAECDAAINRQRETINAKFTEATESDQENESNTVDSNLRSN